jgi:hypothetical protein
VLGPSHNFVSFEPNGAQSSAFAKFVSKVTGYLGRHVSALGISNLQFPVEGFSFLK